MHRSLGTGSQDTDTSHTIARNLAAGATALGDNVNSYLHGDGGHAVNYDADALVAWISGLTGYRLT